MVVLAAGLVMITPLGTGGGGLVGVTAKTQLAPPLLSHVVPLLKHMTMLVAATGTV